MHDLATRVTELYVLVDTCDKATLPRERHGGRPPALARSEVVTLAILGQWARFLSERDFWRWAERHLRPFFPTLPGRAQFNRLVRHHQAAITAFALWLGRHLADAQEAHEIIDGTGIATRNSKRRGVGWLSALEATVGKCSRLGYFHGIRLLLCVSAAGAVTGWVSGPAATGERALATALFTARAAPTAGASAGIAVASCYLADMGFTGQVCQEPWARELAASVKSPPQPQSKVQWTAQERQIHARERQIIESVFGRVLHLLRLEHDRPHTLAGFGARLAAKLALHNVCIWGNRQHGQPDLATADFIAW